MNEKVRTRGNAGPAPARATQLTGTPAKRIDGSPFVGRERELSALTEPLQRGVRDGSVAFVGGEPGIGKSRLLREVADQARAHGWLTLSGRAYDTEGMPAYLPFIEVIREHLLRAPDNLVRALAEGAPELCKLLPEIRERAGDVPEASTLGPEAERFRLFESVSQFLLDIGRQSEANGLVILLDDLHWADKTTVLLLQHFARQLAGVPVFVVAAFRPTDLEQGNPLLGVIPDLLRERLCTQITLGPLEPEHVQALIEGLASLPSTLPFAAKLTRETAGNPFFIEETVRDLLERGAGFSDPSALGAGVPEGIRTVIGRRLSLLRPASKQALQSTAVLGDTFHFKLLSAASELEPEHLTDAVEEAGRAGMLRQEGDSYAFTHALIRKTVYDELSVPRRQHLHHRAAEALESFGATIQDAGLAAIGYHWKMAGCPERAFEYLLRAGEAAVTVAAWEEAARHWQAALDCMELAGEPPARRARLLEGIGDLDFLSSLEVHSCIAHYDRARDLYKVAGDVVGAARASLRAGRSLAYPTSAPDFEGAVDYLREAESVLKSTPDSIELGELYTALGHAESHQLRDAPEQILTWINRLQAVAEKLDSDYLRISACSLEGHYAGLRGELARGLALEERACEWALEMKDLAANKWEQQWHEYLLGYSSDGQATPAEDVGSYQLSRFLMLSYTVNCCGVQSLDLLDPVRARAKHEVLRDAPVHLFYELCFTGEVSALRRTVQDCVVLPAVPTGRGLLSWADGDWQSAADGFRSRIAFWENAGSSYAIVLAQRFMVRILRALGDLPGAQAAAQEWLDATLRGEAVKLEIPARAELALLFAETHRLAEAETHLQRCREVLSAGEDWRGIGGRVRLAEAAFAAANGNFDDAEAHFAAAVETFRALTLPWDEAETFEVWARACRRFHRGRIRQAFVDEKLQSARAIYERIGAGQPWLDRLAQQEAHLAVIMSGPSADKLLEGLSAREVQVLQSIAAGQTNAEIADSLVISPHTVGRHVSNIFGKLGIANRADAAAWAVRNGLAR